MKPHSIIRALLVLLTGALLITLSLAALNAAPVAAQFVQESHVITPSYLPICFVNHGQTVCVKRPTLATAATITDEVRALTHELIAGPTSSDQLASSASPLPLGTQLDTIRVQDNRVSIDLVLPEAALAALTEQQVEDINEQFRTTFTPYNFQRIAINARHRTGIYQPLSRFLKPIEIPRKSSPLSPAPDLARAGRGEREGLEGKTVFVSAGHGWYWHTTLNSFKTQRPVYPAAPYPSGEGVIEDFNNAEAVNQYLLQYLWNAGADAWTVRERDMNTAMLIVDDNSSDFSMQGAWTLNSGGYNGTYRSAAASDASPTATATWIFTPPASTAYAVYVRFPTVNLTRTTDAHFYVVHAGATTLVTITQARDGNNWRFIGRYPFYGGQAARILVTNQARTFGATVLADAVRIGGGMGDTSVAGSPLSNRPRWEEQARQYAKWAGMPNVDDTNDVIVRPIYSEWEKEPGEDAVYISWHTNGYNGYNTVARGTNTYVHDFEPTPNSSLLQNFIHTELLNAIHAGWEATWPDRGKKSQDLGELRLLESMPGVLIENGFHDNPTDVEALKDPRFLQLSARAVYHGLVHYWNSIDPNVPLTFLPEPPQQVRARNSGPGQITIEWAPGPIDGGGPLGDVATAYRVYTSTDGFGWSNPIEVSTLAYTLTQLAPHQLIFVKVTGVNAGGESFASPVLAARAALNGQAHMLIVYGFDRIDRKGDTRQDDPPEGYSRRVLIDRINRFDAILQHAEVITLPFDSAQQAAVTQGTIGLANYPIVDWIAGKNQAPFPALTPNDQTALTSFLNNGGALFISGAEIGYELQGTPFYANTLRASYVADDAQAYSANSASGGIFSGLGAINFDDGSHGMYDVDWPDSFTAINGASSALVYNTASAALQYANGCTRLVYSGIPFEAIYPRAARQALMTRLSDFLGVCLPLETLIAMPRNGTTLNQVPAFGGLADNRTSQVQISIRRISDTTFYNGSSFVTGPEVWLTATNVNPWDYALPSLLDGAYALRAQAVAPGPIVDSSPAAVTFTLDTAPPTTPTLITPTHGLSLTAIAPLFEWTSGGDPSGFIIDVDGVTQTLNSSVLSVTRPVTEGLHYWRVQAFDAAGNQSAWSDRAVFSTTTRKAYLPVILKNYATPELPPIRVCSNTVVNGGFESGEFAPGWSSLSPNPPPAVVMSPVASGIYAARIGAATVSETITQTSYSSFEQALSIPANVVTATLSFARYRWSGDVISDTQYIVIVDGNGAVEYLINEQVHDPTWVTAEFDLKSYAGQTIKVWFGVVNRGAHPGSTGMALDEVQTQICVPQ